jgi:hypothetical protein
MGDPVPANAMVEVDYDQLVREADPQIVGNMQLFNEIGEHCKAMDSAHQDLGVIVRSLRAQKIQLKDWASFNLAKFYIRQTHPKINNDSLDRYTGHLRQLLRMREDHLPVRMSITAALPKWITVGDEVDGQDKGDAWWHGVALEVTSQSVKVYWVGFPVKQYAKRSRLKVDENPMVVVKSALRAHEPDAVDVQSGPDTSFDVAWIKKNVLPLPKSFKEVVHVRSDSDADDNVPEKPAGEGGNSPVKKGEGGAAAARKKGKGAAAEQKSRSRKAKTKNRSRTPEAMARKKSKAAAADSSLQDSSKNDDDDDDDDDDEDDTEDASDAGAADDIYAQSDVEDDADADNDEGRKQTADSSSSSSSPSQSSSSSESGANGSDDDAHAVVEEAEVSHPGVPLGNDADAQAKFLAMRQVFYDVEAAIICLMGLDQGLPVHSSLFADFSKKLVSVARFSAVHYCNSAYDTLASETLTELDNYGGQEKPKLPHTTTFLKALSKYGFCITPRLWKREEILCIAIALLDPRLNFTGIRQKDGFNTKTAFRGMAVLDPRIQRIFYARLKAYGFVNPRFHPEKLQSFSSVVINGGGSWQQDSTWEFPVGTRFQMDTTAVPFMIQVTTEVGALEADGVYVATTTKQNGKPVYVQVSKHEFDGWKARGEWSSQIGFKHCIKPQLEKPLRAKCLDSQGKRLDACSPRVLVCLEGGTQKDDPKWGIQLLPGFGSNFFLLEFRSNDTLTEHANIDAACFASVNYDNFKANYQRCCVNMAHVHANASSVLTKQGSEAGYAFSFGPMKVAVASKSLRNTTGEAAIPTFLRPQGYHWDGPQFFDAKVFDNHGILKTDAPACRQKAKGDWTDMWDNPLGVYLPEHIGIMQESFSALFGVFRGSYIQTESSADGDRGALDVVIPLGCAIIFTFAWKHRGKGDGKHRVTPQSPVDVHARPHFYCYSTDMRRLPTIDFEASLEFISLCAQKQPDTGSQLQTLDTLQTFDKVSAIGHWDARDVHSFFSNQHELESYVSNLLAEQRKPKRTTHTVVKECCDWALKLSASEGSSEVAIVYPHAAGGPDQCIAMASACFDSDRPLFNTSTGDTYILVGPPRNIIAFPAATPDSSKFADEFKTQLLPIAQRLTASLCENWCESRLAHLLSVLDAYAVEDHSFTAKGLRGTYFRNMEAFQHVGVRHSSSSPVYFFKKRCIILIGESKNDSNPDAATDVHQPARRSARASLGSTAPTHASTPRSLSTGILPAIARCKFPSEVHEDEIVWEQWEDCNVRGVGNCNVWNVHANKRSFDSIAIRVAGTEEIFRLNGVTTRYDARTNTVICKEVRPPKKRCQCVYFENVCRSFGAWALPKGQKPDFSAQHEAFFVSSNLLRVECGGNGDCFYHSCLFLLKMYKNVPQETTHGGLRTATVHHLKTHYQSIMALDPELNGDGMPVYCLLPGASLSEASNATDEALVNLVKNYCDTHGKLREYVEDPIIHVFADLMNITIVVYHTTAEDPVTFNDSAGPDESSVMALWCNGGHYMVRYRPPKT